MNETGFRYLLLIALIIGSVNDKAQTNLLLNVGVELILSRETELPPQ